MCKFVENIVTKKMDLEKMFVEGVLMDLKKNILNSLFPVTCCTKYFLTLLTPMRFYLFVNSFFMLDETFWACKFIFADFTSGFKIKMCTVDVTY